MTSPSADVSGDARRQGPLRRAPFVELRQGRPSVALDLTHPDTITTARAPITRVDVPGALSTPPPPRSSADTRAARAAWGIADVDALLASGGAVPA